MKCGLGRPARMLRLALAIYTVRVRGGNKKYRALRLDVENFFWGSECCTCKTRIIDAVYSASSNELVPAKSLGKNCSELVDSIPHHQWYESHNALCLGRKKGTKLNKKTIKGNSKEIR